MLIICTKFCHFRSIHNSFSNCVQKWPLKDFIWQVSPFQNNMQLNFLFYPNMFFYGHCTPCAPTQLVVCGRLSSFPNISQTMVVTLSQFSRKAVIPIPQTTDNRGITSCLCKNFFVLTFMEENNLLSESKMDRFYQNKWNFRPHICPEVHCLTSQGKQKVCICLLCRFKESF